ncbi:SUMO protease, putative [Phytophthora infestans T30-4]|uniref:SUMO protease, putative n=1 Tax=Phytophthora infestans (strain T30-4) TaxID=403677 RepID=D0NYK5_PHYIT|nr:SUMO protease, putative [Phytophthora infestans T30-4]EEY68625.1 SUMO protease, putative [Phytophthora infestans T30-4]|eukprot:XP_002997555.1 SUMO protease, putative [Phytophthora infestans T30-4]
MARQVLNYHDVQLYESDAALFTGHQWLNDNAINFYLQYLTQTVARRDVLLMDPAVVSCLLHQCEDEDEYQELAIGLDLTSKQLCIIPVTDNDALGAGSSHWSLLLYSDGDFQHFDSSSGHNHHAARRLAESFEVLLRAAGKRRGSGFSRRLVEVQNAPQQQNGYDCGMYVLVLAEYFCRQHAELRLQLPKLIEKLKAEAVRA